MLTHSNARTIAESLWGKGGTFSEKTNRKGAFYFHCAGHGGFVISWDALTPEEQEAVRPYVTVEYAYRYHGCTGKQRTRFLHPYRVKGARFRYRGSREAVPFIVLEEDCDWSIAMVLTGINWLNNPAGIEYAESVFNRWIKQRAA